MTGTSALRAHAAHLVVFGLPVVILVGAVGFQELRARLPKRGAGPDAGRGRAAQLRDPRPALERGSLGLRVATVGLVLSAVIHAAVIPEHFRESALYGVFFVALAISQLALAGRLALRPDRRTLHYIAAGSLLVVGLWVVSRTTGLPVGPEPWEAESLGWLDVAATCAELITAMGCLAQLRAASSRLRFAATTPVGLAR